MPGGAALLGRAQELPAGVPGSCTHLRPPRAWKVFVSLERAEENSSGQVHVLRAASGEVRSNLEGDI